MKLVTFEFEGKQRIGAVRDVKIVPLDAVAPTMLALIDGGAPALDAAQRIASAARETIALDRVKLLAPIPRTRKNIFALGRNYGEHAKESAAARGSTQVSAPVIFTKAPTTINAPYGEIIIDPAVSVQIDWEVELGIVIGKGGRKIAREDSLKHVFGYTVINDVTARDLQDRTSQFFVGKSVDGYCPMGPWIVTADEIGDPQNLNLQCRVNGVVKQNGNTHDMIYSVAFVIQDLSLTLTLEAGDVITTGTPSGVGFARKPPEFLKPGDVLESEIEKIGALKNRVVGV
jgi:2-keto-4-pentenoate hydratase/2-oxohepta-3-ene-1,7-dioic acid hydratase in catechol pathway